MIEGVNTVAENVVIFDRRRGDNKTIDDFTFRNIAGRAGRMNRDFIGKVYVLERAVEEGDHVVDLPIERQDGTTPISLLLDLASDSLTGQSQRRLTEVFSGSKLSEATIRQNRYVPISSQNALFDAVDELHDRNPALLTWRGMPDSEQLLAVCDLILDYVDQDRLCAGTASSKSVSFRPYSQASWRRQTSAASFAAGLRSAGRISRSATRWSTPSPFSGTTSATPSAGS